MVNDDMNRDRSFLSRRTFVAGAAALTSVAVSGVAGAQDATPSADTAATPETLPTVPPEVAEHASDWPLFQGNYEATRVAVDAAIDSSNVTTLGVEWELPLTGLGGYGGMTSNPIVVGDTVYLIDGLCNIQAVDKATGAVKWANEYNVQSLGPQGLAVGYGYVVAGLGDLATVIALKADTGEEVWRFRLSNHGSVGINAGISIYDGYIYVSTEPGGNTNGHYEGGSEGILYCLDVLTGETIWAWNTVKDDLWGNFRKYSGGGLWYPPAIDTETGVLYMGIGNAELWTFDQESNEDIGPNDYANCLVALDPNAGKVLWYINLKPHDLFDLDNQQTPVLGEVQFTEQPLKVVFSGAKHGFVIAADRENGYELWRVPVGKHQNDTLTYVPEGETLEVLPGTLGGVQSPMAFVNGILYVAVMNLASSFTTDGPIFGDTDYTVSTGELLAIDGASGAILWSVDTPVAIAGAAPTIANDVVFIGTIDGILRAYSIEDGSPLWSQQLPGGLNAPFAISDDYLFVPAGSFVTSSSEIEGNIPQYDPKLFAFKLGATGTVTLTPASDTSDDASTVATPTAENEYVVEAFDLGFRPSEFTIPANTDITITVINTGVLLHDLVSNVGGFGTETLAGGEQESIVVNLAPGSYEFICSLEGHAAAGMVGTLTVE